MSALCLCSIHSQCGEENVGQDPNTYTVLWFLERRGGGVPQGQAVMRWKIWTNPDPNEGLTPVVNICQLPVNSSYSLSLGAGEGPLTAEAIGPVPRVLFFSLCLGFSVFGM